MIRATARAALEELRQVIGVLRDGDEGGAPEPPQPTLARDPGAGRGEPRGGHAGALHGSTSPGAEAAPAALGRTAYRVVQEGLTNARKHAPAAAVDVTIAAASELVVEVVSRRPVGVGAAAEPLPGAGSGLIGLAERVALAGGELRPRPGRGRRLRPARDAAVGAVTPIRVLLVDDDPLVRSGLRLMLAGAEQVEVVGEADDGRGVLAAVDLHRPDVVLMDIRMPQLDGIAATRLAARAARARRR